MDFKNKCELLKPPKRLTQGAEFMFFLISQMVALEDLRAKRVIRLYTPRLVAIV